jgi:hypothetical protein
MGQIHVGISVKRDMLSPKGERIFPAPDTKSIQLKACIQMHQCLHLAQAEEF